MLYSSSTLTSYAKHQFKLEGNPLQLSKKISGKYLILKLFSHSEAGAFCPIRVFFRARLIDTIILWDFPFDTGAYNRAVFHAILFSLRNWTKTFALNAVALSKMIDFGGVNEYMIYSLTTFITSAAAAVFVSLAIGQLVRFLTAISRKRVPSFELGNGPAKSIENMSTKSVRKYSLSLNTSVLKKLSGILHSP